METKTATPVKPMPESNSQIVTIQIANQTSATLSTGKVSLDWGNQINFNSVSPQSTQNCAFQGQGAQGSATGVTGSATWTAAVGGQNLGTLTCTFDDPWSGSNSFSAVGDATFNANFNVSYPSVPPGGSNWSEMVTITPKSSK